MKRCPLAGADVVIDATPFRCDSLAEWEALQGLAHLKGIDLRRVWCGTRGYWTRTGADVGAPLPDLPPE